jgi:hypothetical protein
MNAFDELVVILIATLNNDAMEIYHEHDNYSRQNDAEVTH